MVSLSAQLRLYESCCLFAFRCVASSLANGLLVFLDSGNETNLENNHSLFLKCCMAKHFLIVEHHRDLPEAPFNSLYAPGSSFEKLLLR